MPSKDSSQKTSVCKCLPAGPCQPLALPQTLQCCDHGGARCCCSGFPSILPPSVPGSAHRHTDLVASEQPKGLSSAFSSSPSSHLPPCSSFSLTSHSNCSPGSHYCSISLFIFPFESLPPAKTVLFLAPSLGVSDLQLGPWSLQCPNSSPRGKIGKGSEGNAE